MEEVALGIRARNGCVCVDKRVCVCLRVKAAVHTASRPGSEDLT